MFVEMTNLCQIFHVLPRPGGLLDQDPDLIKGMTYVIEAQEERRKLEERRRKHPHTK